MLKNIGYIPPKDKEIEWLQEEVFRIIKSKISDVSIIKCAFFGTMNDRNGESLGVFFALPDKFVYVAGVPINEHIIYEEFLIDKISNFTVLSEKEQIHSIKFNIYREEVIVRGFGMKIPNDFIHRLKSCGIILFGLNPYLN